MISRFTLQCHWHLEKVRRFLIIKKKSLNQLETIRWFIFLFLLEFITLIYIIVRIIISSCFLEDFLIAVLFFQSTILFLNNIKFSIITSVYNIYELL